MAPNPLSVVENSLKTVRLVASRLCHPKVSMLSRKGILDQYVTAAPSAQSKVDIFAGEWISKLPVTLGVVRSGEIDLFDDERVTWALASLGGVNGADVLELGPMEAGHTWMLHQAGAASVTSVEANTRLFLKCLIVRDLLEMDRAQLLCGNFVEYLRETDRAFDVCWASGVLYHMQDPVELIALISKRSRRLFLWTHYFDAEHITRKIRRRRFGDADVVVTEGFEHRVHRHKYGVALRFRDFIGGTAPTSSWLPREDLIGALEHFGWTDIKIGFEAKDHPHGPALALTAVRSA